MTNDNLTLILGGTGKTGRRVAERLAALGVPVRVGSRDGKPPFDWADKQTWVPAVHGATAAYLSFYPDVAVPGAAATVRSFAEVAVSHGIRKLVLLSGRGEPEAQLAEEAVREVAPDTTVLRCSWFNQNFSEGYLLDPVLGGEVVLPVGDTPEPFVDADDIADVAVAALTEDGHAGRLYELTGPRLLSFAGAVAEIAAATGRTIRFKPVSIDEYRSMLTEYEVPADVVQLLSYLFTEVLDGRNASVTDGVRRALGRESRDFGDYARETAATGVWTVS
ncbi:NmrA family transcriptional regulator [Amycolatopsis sp. GM8]|uniref:NmrA family transcriptional regulator n=1 Tax=Amycolatopsis sp. GM8 TaxID=2896530 RepID=UPI001F31A32D|nr:NmrA family transcriptional regulator [Amycolatopsis sp. GM8]